MLGIGLTHDDNQLVGGQHARWTVEQIGLLQAVHRGRLETHEHVSLGALLDQCAQCLGVVEPVADPGRLGRRQHEITAKLGQRLAN